MSEEEWNNFSQRITEVSKLVKDLASNDKATSDAASILVNRYLQDNSSVIRDGELGIEMKVKCDRTVINQKAFDSLGKQSNPDQMDPEVWMAEVSKDAEKRALDRKIRKEKADTLKTQAVRAFRRKEYDRALSYFNKAIEQVKDSLLYTDRALTLIRLGRYEKVVTDCEWALRLNENSYKARLYKAKAQQQLEQADALAVTRAELDKKFPQHHELTQYFLEKEDGCGDQ